MYYVVIGDVNRLLTPSLYDTHSSLEISISPSLSQYA